MATSTRVLRGSGPVETTHPQTTKSSSRTSVRQETRPAPGRVAWARSAAASAVAVAVARTIAVQHQQHPSFPGQSSSHASPAASARSRLASSASRWSSSRRALATSARRASRRAPSSSCVSVAPSVHIRRQATRLGKIDSQHAQGRQHSQPTDVCSFVLAIAVFSARWLRQEAFRFVEAHGSRGHTGLACELSLMPAA